MDYLTPLSKVPGIVLYDAPALAPELEEAYAEKLQQVEDDPHLFNGTCTVATGFRDDIIEAYSIDYARGLLYDKPPEGRFLSVGCQIFSQDHMTLWARRGMHVAEYPDHWEPGVSGTLDQASDPEQIIMIELAEELSLEPRVSFMGLSQGEGECQLTWYTQVDNEEPKAHKPEVSEILWLPAGEVPDGKTQPFAQELLQHYANFAQPNR